MARDHVLGLGLDPDLLAPEPGLPPYLLGSLQRHQEAGLPEGFKLGGGGDSVRLNQLLAVL